LKEYATLLSYYKTSDAASLILIFALDAAWPLCGADNDKRTLIEYLKTISLRITFIKGEHVAAVAFFSGPLRTSPRCSKAHARISAVGNAG